MRKIFILGEILTKLTEMVENLLNGKIKKLVKNRNFGWIKIFINENCFFIFKLFFAKISIFEENFDFRRNFDETYRNGGHGTC